MARNRIVKVRVTEAEYCDWVQQAAEASVSLSEAIRRRMGMVFYPDPIDVLESLPEDQGFIATSGSSYSVAPAVRRFDHVRNLPARRHEACPHAKPPYAFCPECDR